MTNATTHEIPISKLVADEDAQPRAEIDLFLVDEYAAAMRAGAIFPPVVVFVEETGEGERFYLADGFHRLRAAESAGLEVICAAVRGEYEGEIGLRAAILWSCSANETHGQRRTNEDERRAVERLVQDQEWGARSARWIAERAGVSHEFVRKVKSEVSTVDTSRTVDGKDGKRYPSRSSDRIIVPEARGLLRDTPVVDDRRALARLSGCPEEEQVAVATRIASGEARNVYEAQRQFRYEEKAQLDLADLDAGKFQVIYADPPWRFDSGDGVRGAAAQHYPCMPTDEIAAMRAGEHATENAVLYLWSTLAHVPDALRVMDAWGFEYRTQLAWVKEGAPGIGYYVRGQHEPLLVGVKGGPFVPKHAPPSVLQTPRLRHSEKPCEMRDVIEQMYPGLRYLELFARDPDPRERWTFWGNEARGEL